MATLVLAFIFAFVAPFRGSIFTFLSCNGEKRSILSWGGGNPFGAFGWALACAHIEPAYTAPVSGAWGGAGVVPRGAGASGAMVIVLEASVQDAEDGQTVDAYFFFPALPSKRAGKRLMLRTLHLATFGGSGVQFLVILCMPSTKGSELMDSELATKVAFKYGRLEVATIIDTRGGRPRGAIVGLWNDQP